MSRKYNGQTVNPDLPLPSLYPGTEPPQCIYCGMRYKDFRAYPDPAAAAARLRAALGRAEDEARGYGPFISRRPILWGMRVIKMEAWQCEHMGCEETAKHYAATGMSLDDVARRVRADFGIPDTVIEIDLDR